MTQYVGEEVRIKATATGYAGEALTDESVTNALITILNKDKTVLVDDQPMSWNDTETPPHWEYLWNTAGLEAGTYRYRVTVVGIDGSLTWEWRRTRFAKNPTILIPE